MKIPSTKAAVLKNKQTFTAFYEAYAPKVWGIILVANLPLPQSEAILMNTITKAWQEFSPQLLREKYLIIRLLKIACEEGLPIEVLQTVLNSNRVLRPRGFFSGIKHP